ncbi:hypothetical protein [Melittangium boletus]|uniref:Lipoprotein n=1 Tax=Melittangium boletus DSM 14713 TaxID=1294270 RepID=A0A250IR99_9BACT|nr:hypothetical protein [Melittangium boletus]ATB34275.1 hypothetical protein MEBOL_007776 [Melittangium boletus DSM 14713]
MRGTTHTGRGHLTVLLLLLCLLPTRALGHPAPGDDSIKARLKACVLAGDLACVVDQYLLLKDIGRAPGWLVAFQGAFATANRKAGECEKVAKLIHEGLTRLGQRPEYLRFTINGPRKVMGFDEFSHGVLTKTHQLSTTGHHVAIRLGDKLIDAYTGPAGLPFHEYMARLSVTPGAKIVHEVIQSP